MRAWSKKSNLRRGHHQVDRSLVFIDEVKWDLRRVLNAVREGEFLTVSGWLLLVSRLRAPLPSENSSLCINVTVTRAKRRSCDYC